MSSLVIPLAPVPAQIVTAILGVQACKIRVYAKPPYGTFVDLYVNDALMIGGVIALDRNKIVRDAYLGFVGDLGFVDTQGKSDPDYTGFGSRYIFVYQVAA